MTLAGEPAVVVVAAGRGERLGGDRPKALVEVAGKSLLAHCLERVRAAGLERIVVVHPAGERDAFARDAGGAVLVAGGATRSASVRAGVAAVAGCAAGASVIAIHDAARAFTPPQVILRVLAAVAGEAIAAAPCARLPDTLKRVDGRGRVAATLDREGVRAVHTPQVVRSDALASTLQWAGDRDATDDLALVELARAAGAVQGEVVLVDGDPLDLKVTHPSDLAVAAALLAAERGQVRA